MSKFNDYQRRVVCWMLTCFGPAKTIDPIERCKRFLEEALELVQALGLRKSKVLELVEYVYDRPAGEPEQEVGGVAVSLMGLCDSVDIQFIEAGETELARVYKNIPRIREKQLEKPE